MEAKKDYLVKIANIIQQEYTKDECVRICELLTEYVESEEKEVQFEKCAKCKHDKVEICATFKDGKQTSVCYMHKAPSKEKWANGEDKVEWVDLSNKCQFCKCKLAK